MLKYKPINVYSVIYIYIETRASCIEHHNVPTHKPYKKGH